MLVTCSTSISKVVDRLKQRFQDDEIDAARSVLASVLPAYLLMPILPKPCPHKAEPRAFLLQSRSDP